MGLLKCGCDPKMEIIESYPQQDYESWGSAERFWIAYFRFMGFKLTNLESGGKTGKSHSLETLNKMSLSQRGKKHSTKSVLAMANALRGIPKSLETRMKISERNKGRKLSPEHVEKVAAKNRGKKRSPELRKRMSELQLGKKRTAEQISRNSAAQKEVWRIKRLNGDTKSKIVYTPELRLKMSISAKLRCAKAMMIKSQQP